VIDTPGPAWRETWRPALLEERLEDGVVRCHLSPRNCRIRPGQHGFCRVRANRGGRLVTLNWGKSLQATEETIETEAVYHYAPGEPILSMGNIGCNLNCDYCHNWRTSQAKFVGDADVHTYTPEQVVDIALRHGIRVISWTYNDPVVWHEFVVETSRLAREAGIRTLHKSAFFITAEAIDQLLPVIDIFSISLKSMDPQYYRKLTKGWLEPVLEGIEQVFASGRHLEISTLMVTDLSDGPDVAESCARFVLDRLGPDVPVHFVRFHPDYKLVDTVRTPVARLREARRIARACGLRHVYLGNVFDPDVTSTVCSGCGALLVSRHGLSAVIGELDASGRCARCGEDANVVLLDDPPTTHPRHVEALPDERLRRAQYRWHGDIRSVHVRVDNRTDEPATAYVRRLRSGANGTTAPPDGWRTIRLDGHESYRFILSSESADQTGVEVAIPEGTDSTLHEVFDRAHFPTGVLGDGGATGDRTPLPLYRPGP